MAGAHKETPLLHLFLTALPSYTGCWFFAAFSHICCFTVYLLLQHPLRFFSTISDLLLLLFLPSGGQFNISFRPSVISLV